MTAVVNIYQTTAWRIASNSDRAALYPDFMYIGRRHKLFRLPETPWSNPFHIGKDGTRRQVLEHFVAYLTACPDPIERARTELRDKTLVCFCKPLDCHGDVWAKIANGEEWRRWRR